MHVDSWFASLDRSERKKVLAGLHFLRDLANRNLTGASDRLSETAKIFWSSLSPLLQALDDDHYDLKPENQVPSAYHLKFCNLCVSSASQQCVAPSQVSSL